MNKIYVLLLFMFFSFAVQAANTPPAGSVGSVQINGGSGRFTGSSLPLANSFSEASPSSFNSNAATGFTGLSSGLLIDPRAYGVRATGCYGIQVAHVLGGGSGFAVGDKFVAQDSNLESHIRGGVNATGHVTAVDGSGAITSFAIDTPGSGYFANGLFIVPITGVGRNASINIISLLQPPSAPSITLASGGGATGTATLYPSAANAYRVGDVFAIPNPSLNGNYMTGVVDSVDTNGAVLTYHINNPGGDYAIVSNVAALTLIGVGKGLTFNITSATSANSTFDDTYGMVVAQVAAVKAKGKVLVPDNVWVANMPIVPGVTIEGAGLAPREGFFQIQPAPYSPSPAPHIFAIGTPTFIIDLNGSNGIYLTGFEVEGYTGTGFGSNTTWDSTICVGNSARTTGNPISGNGAGGNTQVHISRVSGKQCFVGLGMPSGSGMLVFAILDHNDWSANNFAGVWGEFSDLDQNADYFTSEQNCEILTGGGGSRISNFRCEFQNHGFTFTGFGALHSSIIQPTFDRIQECAINSTSQQIEVTGGYTQGTGLGGTLRVTGAADNGSGLIRLTVTGSCSQNGGQPTCDVVTGDKANITGVNGTTEANANQWTLTKVDNTHIDLQGSTFTNPFTSSPNAVVNVNTKGSSVCLSSSTGFYSANVGYWGYSAGAILPSASILDSTNSTDITFIGSGAKLSTNSDTFVSYLQSFANWHNTGNTPASHFIVDVNETPAFRNDNAQTGLGFITGGTKFTVSGCSVNNSTSRGGATGGTFVLGANTCNAVVTMNGATGLGVGVPTNGWHCSANDQTSPTVLIGGEASSTATSATFAIPAGANVSDVISFSCTGF